MSTLGKGDQSIVDMLATHVEREYSIRRGPLMKMTAKKRVSPASLIQIRHRMTLTRETARKQVGPPIWRPAPRVERYRPVSLQRHCSDHVKSVKLPSEPQTAPRKRGRPRKVPLSTAFDDSNLVDSRVDLSWESMGLEQGSESVEEYHARFVRQANLVRRFSTGLELARMFKRGLREELRLRMLKARGFRAYRTLPEVLGYAQRAQEDERLAQQAQVVQPESEEESDPSEDPDTEVVCISSDSEVESDPSEESSFEDDDYDPRH